MEYYNNPTIPVGTRRIRSITRLSLWLSGIGVVVLFLAGLYVRLNDDNLRQFVPVHAQVYIHARNPLVPFSDNTLTQLPITQLLRGFEQRLDIAPGLLQQELLQSSSEIAFFAIPSLTDYSRREVGLLFEIDQQDFNHQELGLTQITSGYYLLTDSADLQLFVEQTFLKQLFSFDYKLPHRQLSAYFEPSVFGTSEPIIASGQYDDGAWKVGLPGTSSEAIDMPVSILQFLDAAIFTQGVSYKSLQEQFSLHTPEFSDVFVDLLKDHQQLASSVRALALVSDEVQPTTFALALSDAQTVNSTELEEIISLFLAQRFPVQETRELPDGTTVIETVINADSVDWQTNGIARMATVGDEYLELGYITLNNEVVISNSSKVLAQLVRGAHTSANFGNCSLDTAQFTSINLEKSSNLLPLAQFLDSKWLILQASKKSTEICLSQ